MSRNTLKVNHWNPYCWMVFLSAMWIQVSVQVPASPTERLWEEIGNVKTMMAAVSDELQRFNTLYLGKLEYRMLAMASTLSSLDSNVKNLQERAHVWDTFQLHVAAWNDQISTLDKKVDILSRGQEKMVGLDGRVLEVDYKVERVVEKLQQTDSKLNAIGKALDDQKDGYPLFGEFATRGVLSTLKLIERKVDRLQGGLSQHVASHHHNKYFSGKSVRNANGGTLRTEGLSGGEEAVIVGGRGGGKLVIRCNTPAAVEDILKDVASKVDIIFDKVSREGEESITKSKGNAVDERAPEEIRTTDAQEAKLLERLWKRLTSPQKKTARALEALEEAVRTSANTTTALWEDAMSTSEQLLGCCQDTNRALQDSSHFLHRLESLLLNVALQEETRTETLSSHFQEQKDFFQQKLSEITCKVPPAPAPETPSQRSPIMPLPDGTGVEIVGSGDDSVERCGIPLSSESALIVTESSCEELQGVGSGVYHLRGAACDLNSAGRNLFTRYCDMDTDGGGWTVIQRRGDFPGPRLNFTLLWQDYKHGFGSLDQEFWLGNEYIHRLTSSPHDMSLRIDLESFDGRKAWAEYSTFRLKGETESYQLVVSGYTGNASDSFSAHNQVGFSTLDRNNDQAPSCCPCVPAYGGGWWFYSCFEANLNGEYFAPGEPREMFRGLIWEHWLGNESLRRTEMKIRPRENRESSSHYPNQNPDTEMPNTTDMYIPEDP